MVFKTLSRCGGAISRACHVCVPTYGPHVGLFEVDRGFWQEYIVVTRHVRTMIVGDANVWHPEFSHACLKMSGFTRSFFFVEVRHSFQGWCETPAAFGAAGASHDSPRTPDVTFRGPGASNTTKIPRKSPREG